MWESMTNFTLWQVILPKREITPQPSHTNRLSPTEPVPAKTPLGEMNMPEPEKLQECAIQECHNWKYVMYVVMML